MVVKTQLAACHEGMNAGFLYNEFEKETVLTESVHFHKQLPLKLYKVHNM